MSTKSIFFRQTYKLKGTISAPTRRRAAPVTVDTPYKIALRAMPLQQVQDRARGGDFNAKTELFRRARDSA